MSHAQFSDFITNVVTDVLLEKTRAILDVKVTAIQFSLKSIELGYKEGFTGNFNPNKGGYDHEEAPDANTIREVYEKAIAIIKETTKPFDLQNPPTQKNFVGVYRLDTGLGPDDGLILIAKNFAALREYLSKKISRNENIKNTFLGIRTVRLRSQDKTTGKYRDVMNEKSTLDIGHMASFGLEEKNSPFSRKIYNVADVLREQAMSTGSQILFKASKDVDVFLEELKTVHLAYKCNFQKDLDLAGSLVGKFDFIFTTTQSAYLNQQILGQMETAIYNKVEKYLHNLRGSPSIIELIQQGLLNAFWGKSVDDKTYISKAEGTKTIKGTNTKSGGLAIMRPPQLRAASGKFFSVLKLQNLINAQLHDRLRANMGTGGNKNTLNYITGRFAKSAKVLSINQRGMALDTYFSYMKYPYATFAPGGKQYGGDRRDPEKLIGRSIREIATGLVAGQFMIRPIVG